jgi:hypothetical protein
MKKEQVACPNAMAEIAPSRQELNQLVSYRRAGSIKSRRRDEGRGGQGQVVYALRPQLPKIDYRCKQLICRGGNFLRLSGACPTKYPATFSSGRLAIFAIHDDPFHVERR